MAVMVCAPVHMHTLPRCYFQLLQPVQNAHTQDTHHLSDGASSSVPSLSQCTCAIQLMTCVWSMLAANRVGQQLPVRSCSSYVHSLLHLQNMASHELS